MSLSIGETAARHKLPAVYFYWERSMFASGGLISYGPDFIDQFRRAAGYVDRIFKGKRRIYRYRHQRSSNWLSTSRPPRHSASLCRRRCLLAPMR